MKTIFEKLNYKGQQRIAVINTEKNYNPANLKSLQNVQIDCKIDPRYPYDFILLFVKKEAEVEQLAQIAIHNLAVNGLLWFCFPKKTSKNFSSDLDKDHGWKAINRMGFHGTQLVSFDDDWSALRFRNKK